MSMKRMPFLCAFLSLVAISVIAQETFFWIGQKVVTKYDYPVKAGDQLVENGSRHNNYIVTRNNGFLSNEMGWAWIKWMRSSASSSDKWCHANWGWT